MNEEAVKEFPGKYLSLADLQANHFSLLERRAKNENVQDFVDEIYDFINEGVVTGLLLEYSPERRTAQSILSYWSNVLIQEGRDHPTPLLSAFDPLFAPKIPDEKCPYVGLSAFQPENHENFFGREDVINQMIEKLKEDRFLAVIGASGSGKSSAVLAGLLPRLQAGTLPDSRDWVYLSPMVPGFNPLESLALCIQNFENGKGAKVKEQVDHFRSETGALALWAANFAAPVLLIVDQFEEVFTLGADPKTRDAFIANLLGLVEMEGVRHTVVLTMRTDFEETVARAPELKAYFDRSIVRLGALSRAQLRESILKPAEKISLKFDNRVVEGLIDELLGEAAALPMLQFSLLKLWENRERNRITWEAYQQIGGGLRALATAGDQLYEKLPEDQQATLKRIMMQIVQPGEGVEFFRYRISREELKKTGENPDRIDSVLNHLVQEHLLNVTSGEEPGGDKFEVAHEALIFNWSLLRSWLDEARVRLGYVLRLRTEARQWDKSGRKSDFLLRGDKLSEALLYERELEGLEHEYLEASKKNSNKARVRLLISLTSVIIVLALLSVFAVIQAIQAKTESNNASTQAALADIERVNAEAQAAIAFEQKAIADEAKTLADTQKAIAVAAADDAATQKAAAEAAATEAATQKAIAELKATEALAARATAEANEKLAISRQLAAQALALVGGQPDLAILLGIEAYQTAPVVEARSSLMTVLQTLTKPSPEFVDVPYQIDRTFTGHTDFVWDVAFSPGGQILASASSDDFIFLWDVVTGRLLGEPLKGHLGDVLTLAFSPNGKTLVSGGTDEAVILWDITTREQLFNQVKHRNWVLSVAFSPDGDLIASGSSDDFIILWDTNGNMLDRFEAHNGTNVNDLDFTKVNGELLLVSGGADGTVNLWKIVDSKGVFQKTLFRFQDSSEVVAFSPNGEILAAAGGDNQPIILLFDVQSGRQIGKVLRGHTSKIFSLAFTDDGSIFASTGSDTTIRLWNVNTGDPVSTPLYGGVDWILGLDFGPPPDNLLASSGTKGVINIWKSLSGPPVQLSENLVTLDGPVTSLDFKPGTNLLVLGVEGTQSQILPADGDEVESSPVRIFPGEVKALAYNLDGTRLVVLDDGGSVYQWTGQGTAILWEPPLRFGTTSSLAFANNQDLLALGQDDGKIHLWDIDTETLITELSKEKSGESQTTERFLSLSFSEEDRYLVAGGEESVSIWDLSAGGLVDQIANSGGAVRSVAFSPQDAIFATGSEAGQITLRNVETRQVVNDLFGHDAPVTQIVFSPDGATLASSSLDGRVFLWDVESGVIIGQPLTLHNSGVLSLAFSPDGMWLASGGVDNAVYLTPVDIDSWFDLACQLTSRNLSQDEWRKYLEGTDYRTTCPKLPPGE